MIQLICHLIGDYLLQTSWMALNKVGGLLPALAHCVGYTIPFMFITFDPIQLFLIFFTHFLIDYTGVVKLLSDKTFDTNTPEYLRVIIGIVRDNTVHLIFNYLILEYI